MPLYCASSPSIKHFLMLSSILLAQKMKYSNYFYLFESHVWQFFCLQIKRMFMSLSHWGSFVSLLRRALTPFYQFSFNICYSAGKSCEQGANYWSKVYHQINWTITSWKITSWDVTCRNITTAVKLLVTSKRGASSLTLVTSLSGKVLKRKKV